MLLRSTLFIFCQYHLPCGCGAGLVQELQNEYRNLAVADHVLIAHHGWSRGREQWMYRGWRLMWWQERTCTGPMQRCASAGLALRLPAQAQPRQRGLWEVRSGSDVLQAARFRNLSWGKSASCRPGGFSCATHHTVTH